MEANTAQSSSPKGALSRQTHRKSRFGCAECKRRRVKCDETKPACDNCARRSSSCHYGAHTYSNTPELVQAAYLTDVKSNSSISPAQGAPGPLVSGSAANANGPCGLPVISESIAPQGPATVTKDAWKAKPPEAHKFTLLHRRLQCSVRSLQILTGYRMEIEKTAEVKAPIAGFDLFDLELWHHWIHRACYTFSENPKDGERLFGLETSKIAFRSPYVAQLIMAVSALHLSRVDPLRKAMCTARSNALQGTAIAGMMQAMAHSTEQSCFDLYLAACMLTFCSFGKGPQPGRYVVYNDEGGSEWLVLLQGVKSILKRHSDSIYPTLEPGSQSEDNNNRRISPEDVLPGFTKQFDDLQKAIGLLQAEDSGFTKYLQALKSLRECFDETFERNGISNKLKICSHMVFAWIYRSEGDYLDSVQTKRPMALVILAHFLVLVEQLKGRWYLGRWVPHIMAAIRRDLHPSYQRWLEWPGAHILEVRPLT